jgi:hypothetical protein
LASVYEKLTDRSVSVRGDATGALATILTDCPYGDDVDEAKVREMPFFMSTADTVSACRT